MMDFTAFLHASGLRPRRAPVADGQWRRCPTESHPKKRNGAYCLAPDGLCGWAQDWATDTEVRTWRPESVDLSGGPAPARIGLAEIRRRQTEEAARQRAATAAARAHYDSAMAVVGGHPYLTAHGLDMSGCRGLRVDRAGWLVVPMRRGGEVISVQRIAEDGDKRFWPGAPTSGAGYAIQRQGATVTVLCEGLATGLAIYAALPSARVVVAFNAGNLVRVAAQLPRRGLVAVAADNDHETETRIGRNPGVQHAREAAALLGCGAAVPMGIQGTDWCDYAQERRAAGMAVVYGRRAPREGDVRSAVDAEIRAEVMRVASFLGATG